MAVALRSWRRAGSQLRARDIERRLEQALAERRSVDPRIQLAILVMMNLMATTPTPAFLDIAGLVLAAALLAYGGRWVNALKWLVGYAALWLVAVLCSVSADPFLVSVGAMLMMMRKMYAIAMLATHLVLTVRVGELACALQRMHVPRLLIVALSVSLRFFPTLAAEASAVVGAMKLRGIRLSLHSVLQHPLRMIEYFAVPLMLRISVVTDEVSRAATVRGIDSRHSRTSLYALCIGRADCCFLLSFVALTIASAVCAYDSLTFMGLF
ncbi:MAG: energy-coupling factor transporter transmembrane protein EcfT [Coriobacteriales bacterium]|jgi:energy-coupling factor transport system permease protein|nr:energy-coupling factor transporter transmembrane protein EcfT [Coriobacteriales bacterium]